MAGDDKLATYRRKRDPGRTPEPVPDEAPLPQGNDDTFVIQEHHATALHWDFRLERDGVLVSWAVPKGLPLDPQQNRLAVHTEDHPLEYASFADDIPSGEYGGGTVTIWDRGTYETEKWSDREVMVVLHGARVSGRYVLFRTRDDQWMVHRMDPAPDGWEPLPEQIAPMIATPGSLPETDAEYAYELDWGGARIGLYVEGGRVRALDLAGDDVAGAFPELRTLGRALGSTTVVLDGVLVGSDTTDWQSASLARRLATTDANRVRRLAEREPATYVIFDVLYLDGRHTTGLPYVERRALLRDLELGATRWTTAPSFDGGGAHVLATAREHGMAGVVAKRLASPYTPGPSPDWIAVGG